MQQTASDADGGGTLHVIADHPACGGLSGGSSRMTLLLQTFGSLGGAQVGKHGLLGAGGHLHHADLNQLDCRSRLIRGVAFDVLLEGFRGIA